MWNKEVLVIKVGSSLLVNEQEDGTKHLDKGSFRRIGHQICSLTEQGYGVITVTSGSMAAGQAVTGSTRKFDRTKADDWADLQRFAGIGWPHILGAWRDAVGGHVTASMQLTRNELSEDRHSRTEALSTIKSHLTYRDLLFINENDAIAHEEIAYGDNDILAAIAAAQIARNLKLATRLILLTDTNGIYQDAQDATTRIATIDDVDAWRHVAVAGGRGFGLGNMSSKFDAAGIAGPAGVDTYVANGRQDDAVSAALAGLAGTRLVAATT